MSQASISTGISFLSVERLAVTTLEFSIWSSQSLSRTNGFGSLIFSVRNTNQFIWLDSGYCYFLWLSILLTDLLKYRLQPKNTSHWKNITVYMEYYCVITRTRGIHFVIVPVYLIMRKPLSSTTICLITNFDYKE